MGKFSEYSIERTEKYQTAVSRNNNDQQINEIVSPFRKDYEKILHSTAYRRLKHKTQVFFSTSNDHICTRIEHVSHVADISYTISSYLGLNTELATAIAIGHDLGHAPFGHEGEGALDTICKNKLQSNYWHEYNGLYLVDNLEVFQDNSGRYNNLFLTYAVRDGIVCHCGEVDDESISPRKDTINLQEIQKGEKPKPFTWEACIVKIADKIAYLGRDIEDALLLNILSKEQIRELITEARRNIKGIGIGQINNLTLIDYFIKDLCKNSTPEQGIIFSDNYFHFLKFIKDFNYKNIYKHEKLNYYKQYVKLVINTIYELLTSFNFDGDMKKLDDILIHQKKFYSDLIYYFSGWLMRYSSYKTFLAQKKSWSKPYNNIKQLYDLSDKKQYEKLVIDFIGCMTDNFAVKAYNEIISFNS